MTVKVFDRKLRIALSFMSLLRSIPVLRRELVHKHLAAPTNQAMILVRPGALVTVLVVLNDRHAAAGAGGRADRHLAEEGPALVLPARNSRGKLDLVIPRVTSVEPTLPRPEAQDLNRLVTAEARLVVVHHELASAVQRVITGHVHGTYM